MKKFLILALLAVLIMPSLALPDLESQLKGDAMVRDGGAPWFGDGAKMYFGTDKDGYIWFNSTSGYVEMSGMAAGNLTLGGTVGSGNDITFTGGDSVFDGSAASGAFTTMSGTNTLSGNTVISGSKTFTTGTGAVAINGDVTIAATKGITKTAGAGNFDFSAGTGTFLTSTGDNTLSGDTTISGNKSFTTGTGAVTLKGSTSIDAGKTLTVGGTFHRTNTSATNITISDTDPDFWFCGNSTEPGNQTYTLPTASANTGRIITFIVKTNPGANYVRVDGEGAETVDGTAIQATTDGVGTLLQVICDGSNWFELNSIGTWAGHA